jgi:phosphate starvation-inducible protein PhoH and related proteins
VAAATTQVKILVPGHQSMVALLGQQDVFLKLIEAAFSSDILVRGNEITITGPDREAEQLARLFEELLALLEKGHQLSDSSVGQTIELIKGGGDEEAGGGDGTATMRPSEVLGDTLLTARGTSVAPKTVGQKRFVDAMRSSTVTFAIGPAGTGKTYLAVATAVRALHDHQVSRLILTRPAVEAGERLGFLPGTLYEKIDPYMRPLYDALFEMTGGESLSRLMERGTVEVAPLAFMRGRTLNDAFIILDEAQNTTPQQMKMFLTRLGFGSKMVITGDVTQIDLPKGRVSGLQDARRTLTGVEGVSFVGLRRDDIVRSDLVMRIVDAYEGAGEGA